MKFEVNENCIGCGLCVSICPSVFELNDDGIAKAPDEEIESIFEEDARQAMDSCPVNAIEQE